MPRLLVLLFVFLIGIGSVPVEARELSSEKLSHRIQALQVQITSIQNKEIHFYRFAFTVKLFIIIKRSNTDIYII